MLRGLWMGYLVFIDTSLEASSVSPIHHTCLPLYLGQSWVWLWPTVVSISIQENPFPSQCLILTEILLSAVITGTKITANYYNYPDRYLYSLWLNIWGSNSMVDYFPKHHPSSRDFIFILRLDLWFHWTIWVVPVLLAFLLGHGGRHMIVSLLGINCCICLSNIFPAWC